MTTADKMRAAEKLLSRLSERKKSIIEHVKQQTELYSQHLASKLLIEGIQPPSWLRDPSASGSKELNEEDLISKLLRQYPQSSAPWSVARYPGHNNLVITGDDEKFSEGNFVENSVSNKDFDQKNDPAAPGFSGEDHGECLLDMLPEQNARAASPEDQTDERILNIYSVLDQSLARIQRSKSRQKALELRSSAKEPEKSGLRHESTSDVVSSQIRFSLSITDQPGQNNELPSSSRHLPGKSDISSKGERANNDSFEPDVQESRSPGKKVIEYHSRAKVPERSGLRHESTSDVVSSQIRFSLSIINQPDQNNELPSSSRHLPEKSDISSKGDRTHRDSFEPESPHSHVGNFGPVIGSAISNAYNDSSEAELKCRRSEVQDETHKVLSELVGTTYIQILPEELHAKPGLESSPLHCMEQENCNDEASDKDQQVLSAPESKSSRLSYGYYSAKDLKEQSYGCVIKKSGTNQIAIDEIKQDPSQQYQISSWPEDEVCSKHDASSLGNNSLGRPSTIRLDGKNSALDRRIRHAGIESWPQVKRRKIEHQQAHIFTTSQSFPLTKPHTFQRDPDIIYPKTMDLNIDTDVEEHIDKSSYDGICSEVNLNMKVGIQSPTLSHHELPSSSRHLPRKSDISCEGERAHMDPFEPEVQESPDMSLNMMEGIQPSTLSQHELPSSSRHLRGKSDILSKGERAHRDSFEPDVHKSPHTHVGNFGSVIGSAILNASNDSSEAELNCRSSEVQHETHNVLSKLIGTTDNQNPIVELLVNHGLESSHMHCMEQGDCNHEANDKDRQVSSASESKISTLLYGQNSAKDPEAKSYCCSIEKTGMIQIANDEIKQCPGQQYQILSSHEDEVCSEHGVSSLQNNSLGRPSSIRLDGKNSSLERRLRHARIESWPQVKRRKIEHQQAHVCATSQSFRVRKSHTLQRDPDIIYLKTMEIDIDTGAEEHVNKGTDDGICSEVNLNMMEGIQSATLSQHGEIGSCHIKKNEQLVATISSLAMKESGNSQGCFIEGTRTSPASCDYLVARTSEDKQCSQNLCNLESNADLTSESLNLSRTLHKEIRQSPKWEDGMHLQHPVLYSSNEDPHLTDVDQSMPVFEGFFVNQQSDTDELDFAADGFDLCELDLPRSTLERASILAEICRSASLDRPSSHFSSALKFQETSNLCKSLSDDGYLDHMEFGNNYPLTADLGTHFKSHSSSSDDYKDALDGMPYSVPLAYSGERYGWDSRNQPPSPVGKLWNQLSSHTGSSGKCSISNPELTCFPIEEDPSSSEENKTMEENAGDTLDETDSSLGNHCDKRQPLKDLTNMDTNPPMSASPEEETKRADSMDFLSSKFSVTAQEKTFLGPKYHGRKKSETSGKQTSCTRAARKHQLSSIGSNATKSAKESLKDSSSKLIMSKTSLKGQDHKLSLRESRTNNIVSNVRSFIPLVQQKQAATTACTGKRDVKVKALEAAEAAKRLMEKKINERNQRKEALKFERAEKNLKHMELENKRKEEERKKKNADIAKKRLREDDQKKEKEKKRMRLESRQRQREQEEKKGVERPERENQRTKNGQLNIKKEFNNESKKQQNKETTGGEGMAMQKTDANFTLDEVVRNHEECSTSGLSCDGEEMHAVDKSPRNEDLIAQKNKGKSYDISPYQCSDEEDEDDDELPIKKFVPSWSSRSSIALYIPLQQEVDPDMIFPPDSFCSMDEVLLHRKLQKKQAVA